MLQLLIACHTNSHAPDDRTTLPSSDTADPSDSDLDDTADGYAGPDPFAEQEDTSEGLTNVSADLRALLENGSLDGACEAWEADPDDQRKKLLCGKWMFFYEAFDTLGPPAQLYDFYAQNFSDTMGEGFSKYGLVADPYSKHGRNLGMGTGKPLGEVEALAYTCASCHFGQLPDGRYAVGAPNYAYDYGRHTLALGLLAKAVVPGWSEEDHNERAIELIRPELNALADDWWLQMDFFFVLMGMINIETEVEMDISIEAEGHYANWRTGTMDFLIEPLPLDDGIHTIHKILPLWSIPTEEEIAAYDMPSAMLSWTGAGTDLYQFLEGFILIGGGTLDEWPRERLAPLVEYIHSLRAPENLNPPDASLAATGEALFYDAGCIDCHDGARGSSREVFTLDEIGTDMALQYFSDLDQDGVPCCGLDETSDNALTHGVKAPRIDGVFWMNRLLHNGSVSSLDELLCVGGERTPITEWAYGNDGHLYGCELSPTEKASLIAFLESI